MGMPVLRVALEPDCGPRDPTLEGRQLELGEHRRLVRAVQPPQGRPAAAPGRHAPQARATHAARGDLHPRRLTDDPDGVAAVPAPGGMRASEAPAKLAAHGSHLFAARSGARRYFLRLLDEVASRARWTVSVCACDGSGNSSRIARLALSRP